MTQLQHCISHALAPLVSLPLSGMEHAGFQIFEFGARRACRNQEGEEVTLADYTLHVSCAWRVLGPTSLVLGSADYKAPGRRPRHARARVFFERMVARTLTVLAVGVDPSGGLCLQLEKEYRLEVLPLASVGAPEYWRLLGCDDPTHFVVTARGTYRVG